MRRRVLAVLALCGVALWALNTSRFATRGETPPRLVAHVGVHQDFPPEGVRWDTCTAARIHPPTHGYIDNTLPSMRAAFAAGADIVELDVHATRDGHLAVFHDHMLECRTDGSGAPEDHILDELRGLDLGHGYTADGGQTFPLRGTGVGLLSTLPEVFAALPGRRFLIHVKSGRAEDGDLVADALAALPTDARAQQIVYGGAAAERVAARWPEVEVWTKARVKRCATGYLATGWLGRVPEACHDTWVVLPSSYAWWMWGWPHRFEQRMRAVGSEVVLAGPMVDGVSTGFKTAEQVRAEVPEGFGGLLWVDRVETIGPAMVQGDVSER